MATKWQKETAIHHVPPDAEHITTYEVLFQQQQEKKQNKKPNQTRPLDSAAHFTGNSQNREILNASKTP
jgi:hypothetical protein